MSAPYVQIHPKVNPELGKALQTFAQNNGLTLNKAVVHVLTLGLNEMSAQFGGSLSSYISNISLKDQEIH